VTAALAMAAVENRRSRRERSIRVPPPGQIRVRVVQRRLVPTTLLRRGRWDS
jgi:hypothetical protein